jgi:uncharacterized protein (UPF0262 family)
MPRFLHSSDPALSDLNRAKRNVNADYKKQYSAQDGNHDNLGQSEDVDSIFNTLSTRLTSLQTSLQDVFNILDVGSGALNFFSPQQIATFQQFASRVLNEVQAVQTIMSRIKTFNIFTPPQANGLSEIVLNIVSLQDFIEGTLVAIGGERGQQLSNIISTYEPQFKLLSQFLTGASKNYRAIESNPKAVEAVGMGRRKKRGGFQSNLLSGFQPANDPISRADYARLQGGVAYHYRPPTMTGGAIVPAYNGLGVFGSDGYRIGDYFTYNDPRRFY